MKQENKQENNGGLTWLEKYSILAKLGVYSILHPRLMHGNSYGVPHARTNHEKQALFIGLVVFFAYFILAGLQSQTALPGDRLYNMKTRIVESVYAGSAFIYGKSQELEARLIRERIIELEVLASTNSLTARRYTALADELSRRITLAGRQAVRSGNAALLQEELMASQQRVRELLAANPYAQTYLLDALARVSKTLEGYAEGKK